MNVALSLSYCSSTRVTNALLLGLSPIQAVFLYNQVKKLATIAGHPALLPTLLSTYRSSLLEKLIGDQMSNLFLVENQSGQTFVSVLTEQGILPRKNPSDEDISNNALGIMQLAPIWECYAKSLLLQIESIKRFIQAFGDKNPEDTTQIREMLLERLDFLYQKGNMMLYKVQSTRDRGSAQVSAV